MCAVRQFFGMFRGDSYSMGRHKFFRGIRDGQLTRLGFRSIAALGMLAMLTTLIIPLATSTSMAARRNSISVPLPPALPYNPAIDPAALLGATTLTPVALGTSAKDIGAMVQAALNPGAVSGAAPAIIPTLFSPGVPAPVFAFRSRSPIDNARAMLCLTSAIYYEAASEPDEGQRAVAQVILNRVRHPAYPKTICDVVYQGTERPGVMCQFSYACDGSMARTPALSAWVRARRNAQLALAGSVYAPVGLSTHYHTMAVSPLWDRAMTPTAIVGAHIFYRMPGGAGEARAFSGGYRGNEPLPGPRAKLFDPNAAVIMADAGLSLPLPVAPPSQWIDPASAPATPSATRMASIAPVKRVGEDKRYVSGALPESDIRPEYAGSGAWITR